MRRDLYEPDHEAFREVVQAYVKREVTPNQPRWEQEHIVDRQAWLAAGKQSIIGLLIPDSNKMSGRTLEPMPSGEPSTSGIVDACGPGSPDSHRVVWGLTSRPSGSPAGFPPVSRLPAGISPFARLPLVSLRPAFSGSSPSAAARVPVPLRRPSGFPSAEQSRR